MRTKTPLQSDKMLAAAARLFGTQQFHEVRMEDIALEAKVGKGTLYRYFKDKEELYMALVARSSRQILEQIQEKVARAEGPQAKLQAIVAAIIDFFDEQPHLFDLIQRAEVLHGPDFPWKETRADVIRLVLNVFAEGQDRSVFSIRHPDLAVLMLLAGLRGVIRFGQRPRPQALSKAIVEGFLDGYAGEKSGRADSNR